MNYFTKKRLIIWAIVFLFITNISTLGTILYQKWYWKKEFKEPMRNIKFLKKELNLTDSQEKQIKIISQEHFLTVRERFHELKNNKIKMFECLNSSNPDSILLDSIATKVGSINTLLCKDAEKHFLNMSKILNKNQKEKMNILYKKMKKRKEKDEKNCPIN